MPTDEEFNRHVMASMFGTPASEAPRVRVSVAALRAENDALRELVRAFVDWFQNGNGPATPLLRRARAALSSGGERV